MWVWHLIGRTTPTTVSGTTYYTRTLSHSLSHFYLLRLGPVFCLLLEVSSGCAKPITRQVTSVTCLVIGRAQPELTQSKRQKTGPGVGTFHLRGIQRSCIDIRVWDQVSPSNGHQEKYITESTFDSAQDVSYTPMAHFTKEVNPSLAKPPLNFNGGLAKHRLPSQIK